MTAHAEPDVLVVGAGPTGLTLAAQLRALGAGVRIVDRQLERVHESRALAMQPRTLEVLRGLRLAQTLVERGNDTSQLRIHAGERVVAVRLFDVGLEDTAYPFLLFISQAETEAVLNEHLAEQGVNVERGVELVEFEAGEESVLCTLRHRDEGRSGWMLATWSAATAPTAASARAPGSRSKVARIRRRSSSATSRWTASWSATSRTPSSAPSGMLFFFPLARPASWRMLGIRPPGGEGEQERAQPALAELQAIADTFTGGSLRLRDPAWLTYFRLHHRHAARYRAGRVFLAGDAAHVHSPAGAQGMNTGIQEAWNLGWKLALVARGIADEALLDTYEIERQPIGRFVLRFTDRAARVATSESRVLRLLRTQLVPRLAPVVLRSSRARAYGFRTLAQLRINYRGSPAVEEGEPALSQGRRPATGFPTPASPATGKRLVTGGRGRAELSPPPLRTHRRLGRRPPRRSAGALRRPCRAAPAGQRNRARRSPRSRRASIRSARRRARGAVPRAARRPHRLPQRRHRPGAVERYLARWLPGAGREPQRSSREAPTTKE